MKERNETVDILRGVAILAVILGHAVQRGLVYNFNNTLAWKLIYSFHMPLFVLLSGFTLYLSKPNYDFRWLKNKFYSLIVPLISWTIIVQLMSNFNFTGLKPFSKFPDSTYSFMKLSILHPDWAFWFLWTIFTFMLIFYVVNTLTEKDKRVQKYQILIYISIEIIFLIIPKQYFGLYNIYYYFPIFVCGYYLSKYEDYIFKYLKYALLPSVMVWMLFFEKWSNANGLYRYVIAFSAMITIYYLVTLLKKHLKWLMYFGKRSLELYVCESICLNIGIGSGYIRIISIFITATALSLLIAKILKSNKYTNFIAFGSHKNIKIFNYAKVIDR